jgi:hypothetical protein
VRNVVRCAAKEGREIIRVHDKLDRARPKECGTDAEQDPHITSTMGLSQEPVLSGQAFQQRSRSVVHCFKWPPSPSSLLDGSCTFVWLTATADEQVRQECPSTLPLTCRASRPYDSGVLLGVMIA